MPKRKSKKINKRKLEFAGLITIAVISIILWNTWLIYPIKLFVIIMHEVSHGIAGILTGGIIESISFSSDLGGKCVTVGGVPIVIASAGYLGSLLWGSSIYLSSLSKKNVNYITLTVGILLLLISLTVMDGTFSILSTIAYGMLFITLNYFSKYDVTKYLLRVFGLISCLYVVVDLKEDLFSNSYYLTDVNIINDLSGVPELLISVAWLSISAFVVFYLLKKSY